MSEVGSARKRGLRALLSVRSPVPSATAAARAPCLLLAYGRTRRMCTPKRGGETEREKERQKEGERERERERGTEREKERESAKAANGPREGGREGDGSVSSRAGCCVGQVRVAPWLVARGPGCAHGEEQFVAEGQKEREKGSDEIGGVDSPEEREREKARGGRAEPRSLPRSVLPLAVASFSSRGSSEGLLLYSSFFSCYRALLRRFSLARSLALGLAIAHARMLAQG